MTINEAEDKAVDPKTKKSFRTKDRIVKASLELFNTLGEPKVTTIDISNELDISPGNLYYHFRNKDDIIQSIYDYFETELLELLSQTNELRDPSFNYWSYTYLYLDKIWQYRFLFLHHVNIFSRNKTLHKRFNRMLDKAIDNFYQMFSNLNKVGILKMEDDQVKYMVEEMVAYGTFWITFETSRTGFQEINLHKGVAKMLSLMTPNASPMLVENYQQLKAHYLQEDLQSQQNSA